MLKWPLSEITREEKFVHVEWKCIGGDGSDDDHGDDNDDGDNACNGSTTTTSTTGYFLKLYTNTNSSS